MILEKRYRRNNGSCYCIFMAFIVTLNHFNEHFFIIFYFKCIVRMLFPPVFSGNDKINSSITICIKTAKASTKSFDKFKRNIPISLLRCGRLCVFDKCKYVKICKKKNVQMQKYMKYRK